MSWYVGLHSGVRPVSHGAVEVQEEGREDACGVGIVVVVVVVVQARRADVPARTASHPGRPGS